LLEASKRMTLSSEQPEKMATFPIRKSQYD
jgi:hypothetical protein